MLIFETPRGHGQQKRKKPHMFEYTNKHKSSPLPFFSRKLPHMFIQINTPE